MIKKMHLKINQNGVMMATLIILMTAFTIIGLSLISYTTSQNVRTRNNVFGANAVQLSEAGIEQSVHQLNQDESFTGYVSEQEFFNNQQQGRGVYSTTIEETADTNAKLISSSAKVYRYGTSDVITERKARVTVVGTNSEGYSVYTGPGGLILSGSANIVNSDIYVGGSITMSGAARIGTNAQPLDVNVAHNSCPSGNNPGPSYPQVCTSGEPISLQWSTFIYGSVCATNQVSYGPNPSRNIQPGSTGQGLILGCSTPPAITQPAHNRNGQIAAVSTTSSGSDNTYVCNSWPFNRTWPDGLRLNGNVNIGSVCNVTINGDAYITGNLDIGGASRITVSNSLGTRRPVVMVDGEIDVGGSSSIVANSSGTSVHFISYKSNAACGPNCTSLSGNELKNTQNLETITVGGAANMPGVVYQAYWGRVRIGGSGNIGSAVGQTVDLSGAGTITFGTQLSSGSRSWTVTSYQQVAN